eukprot:gene12535-15751_t
MESLRKQERKSGVEAWSQRVHDVLKELPYSEFLKPKGNKNDVSFHRIAFFKCAGVTVWEADFFRKHQFESRNGSESTGGPSASRRQTSSPQLPSMLATRPPLGSSPPGGGSSRRRSGAGQVKDHLNSRVDTSGLAPGDSRDDGDEDMFQLDPESDDELACTSGPEVHAAGNGQCNELQQPLELPELPELCWLAILGHVGVREVCMLAKGHTGRVSCVAFDDDIILSGCTQATLKVWGMDDLKCRRTLRGHEAALAVGYDAWASALRPLRTFDSPYAVPALQLLHSLTLHEPSFSPASDDLAEEFDYLGLDSQRHHPHAADPWGSSPFTCISQSGNLLAAGRAGEVVLWDLRSQAVVASVSGGALANGGPAPCAGVQLDEDWKLVSAFDDTSNAVCVYDIRALTSAGKTSQAVTKLEPVQRLTAPSKINCFQYHDRTLVAGLEGRDCTLWSFMDPKDCKSSPSYRGQSNYGQNGDPDLSNPTASAGGNGGKKKKSGVQHVLSGGASRGKKKKKSSKLAKAQNSFPKHKF